MSSSPSFPTPNKALPAPIKEPLALAGIAPKRPTLFPRNERTEERFFGFSTANIRNKNTPAGSAGGGVAVSGAV